MFTLGETLVHLDSVVNISRIPMAERGILIGRAVSVNYHTNLNNWLLRIKRGKFYILFSLAS